MALVWGRRALGGWSDERASNLLDGGAPFYDTYACKDGRHVAVGALEPQFYEALLVALELPDDLARLDRLDPASWPLLRERLRAALLTRTRDEWCALVEGTDACLAPVLTLAEAPAHPHNQHRKTFSEVAGVLQPAPAPRLSRTPGATRPPAELYAGTDEALVAWGIGENRPAGLRAAGVLR